MGTLITALFNSDAAQIGLFSRVDRPLLAPLHASHGGAVGGRTSWLRGDLLADELHRAGGLPPRLVSEPAWLRPSLSLPTQLELHYISAFGHVSLEAAALAPCQAQTVLG